MSMVPPAEEGKLKPLYYLWLASSLVVGGWFDETAILALFNPSTDSAGNLVFEASGQKVYPFTYAAALTTILGITFQVYRSVRRWWSIFLGLLLGRAVALSISIVYEQLFIFFGWFKWRDAPFELYWSADNAPWTLLKISYLASLYPWASRRGLIYSCIILAISVTLFWFWLLTGYELPHTGIPHSYLLNAATKIALYLTPVLLFVERRQMSLRRYAAKSDAEAAARPK